MTNTTAANNGLRKILRTCGLRNLQDRIDFNYTAKNWTNKGMWVNLSQKNKTKKTFLVYG